MVKFSLSHPIQETGSIDWQCHLKAFTIRTIQLQPFLIYPLHPQNISNPKNFIRNLTQEFLFERSARGKKVE